ncbi:MAG TPA: MMPL family transporter, partial [Candidatus Polarisedimenticolia bacterium]|nr:MMPL family transporter [Candidatus Polarisedimenticolia bacterium]
SPLREATEFVDRHLTGVNSLEILVAGVAPEDPEGLARVAAFEREVRAMPGIRKVTALPDLYARANRAFHGGDDAFERLPKGPTAGEDLADMHEMIGREAPSDLARFVTPDARWVRVAVRVTALDTASSQALFEEIRRAADRHGLGDVELTGSFAVLSDMSTSLVYNQIRGLAPGLAAILVALMLQFRSVRLGLLSAIPNAAPVVMVYGLMGWAGIALSVPTAMIASIALGLTDDGTIHLLARYRAEHRSSGDHDAALRAMLETSGRAVVFSTITLALGFWAGALSSFTPSVHFAVLTGAALLLALVSQAVLLPLSLVLFKPLGRSPRPAAPAGLRASHCLVLALACALAAGPLFAAPPAPDVVLKDQMGKPGGPGSHRGKIVLLLYGEPLALRRMKSWELKILEKAGPDLAVVRAIDARGVAGKKSETEVNERLRKGVPAEVSILVDWKGDLARRYGLPAAEISVTILDAHGASCGTAVGPVTQDALQPVLALISRTKETGACPVRATAGPP